MDNISMFETLYSTDFNVNIFNVSKQYWSTENSFSCIDSPKTNDMFFFLTGSSGEYTLADGTIIPVPKKSIVYVPKGSRYIFKCTEVDSGTHSTVIMNFDLFDCNGKSFTLNNNIKILNDLSCKRFEKNLYELVDISSQHPRFPSALKSGFYKFIAELCRYYHNLNIFSSSFKIIAKGILYLEENENIDLPVSEIAKMCNVSEIYFRKLFKQYSGLTPVQFKMNKKIERAMQYLAFENKTIKETAALLNFNEISYFCRVFKDKTGVTPGEYIKSNGGNSP